MNDKHRRTLGAAKILLRSKSPIVSQILRTTYPQHLQKGRIKYGVLGDPKFPQPLERVDGSNTILL